MERSTRNQSVSWMAVAAIVALLCLAAGSASAQEVDTARSKAIRGATGVAAGILEIPGNIYKEAKARGPVRGASVGLVAGVGMFVVRECVGFYELFTAPLAWPNEYRPVLRPEFTWEYFTETQRVRSLPDW